MSENIQGDNGLQELRYVGPSTATALHDENVDVEDIRAKRVSYQFLVDTGINAGVATKIRRWHSLPWTFDSEETQLDNRSKNVRGLRDGEREWVAASAGSDSTTDASTADGDWTPSDSAGDGQRSVRRQGDWSPSGTVNETEDSHTDGDWTPTTETEPNVEAETDGGGTAAAAESAWRDRAEPDPVTAVTGVTDEAAGLLQEAGVTSARRLATSDPEQVADLLNVEREQVVEWHSNAEEFVR